MKKDVCKFFNGIQCDTCEKGIPYDTWRTPGESLLATLPCFNRSGVCGARQYPSTEEIKAYEAESAALLHPISTISDAVARGETEGELAHSCGGSIKWTRKTGHLRGACSGCNWSVIE